MKERQKDVPIDEHLKMIKVLTAMYSGKQLYIECFPTDEGALCFPNSNKAVKPIDWPDFSKRELI